MNKTNNLKGINYYDYQYVGPTGPMGPTGPQGTNGNKFNTFTTSNGSSTPTQVTPSPVQGGNFGSYVEGNLAYIPGNSIVIVASNDYNVRFEGYVQSYTNYTTFIT